MAQLTQGGFGKIARRAGGQLGLGLDKGPQRRVRRAFQRVEPELVRRHHCLNLFQRQRQAGARIPGPVQIGHQLLRTFGQPLAVLVQVAVKPVAPFRFDFDGSN